MWSLCAGALLVLAAAASSSSSSLQRLLGPTVTENIFFERFYEKEPLHIQFKQSTDRYQFLDLGFKQVDDLIRSASALDGSTGPPRFNRDIMLTRRHRDPKSGESLTQGFDPQAPHANVTVSAVHAMFRRGFSLVLNAVNHRHKPVTELTRTIGARFGVKANANLYLTPPGGEAFDPHMDWMDGLVLQLHGAKTWRFHAEPRVPRAYHGLLKKPTKCNKFPSKSVTLEPGDLLYVPRGLVHEVIAEPREASMHLTVGIEVEKQQTGEQVMRAAIRFGMERARQADVDGETWRTCREGGGGSHAVVETVVALAGGLEEGLLRRLVLPESRGEGEGLCEALQGVKHPSAAGLEACCTLGYSPEIWARQREDMAGSLERSQRNVTQNVERHWRELQFIKLAKAEKYRHAEALGPGDIAGMAARQNAGGIAWQAGTGPAYW